MNYDCDFNLAVASPQEARGYRRERWEKECTGQGCDDPEGDEHSIDPDPLGLPKGGNLEVGQGATDGGGTYVRSNINVEGSFLKVNYWANTARYHSPEDTLIMEYELKRWGITAFQWMADNYKILYTDPGSNANYEYEERFWFPEGRPSGDFLALGSEKRWQKITDFDYHTP